MEGATTRRRSSVERERERERERGGELTFNVLCSRFLLELKIKYETVELIIKTNVAGTCGYPQP